MSAIFVCSFLLLWLVFLGLSGYGTYRLYEYGPFNANLQWSLVRNVTDLMSCIALGFATAQLIAETFEGGGYILYYLGAFCIGFAIGRIILLIILFLVAGPYLKKERKRNERFDAAQKAEAERITSGSPPERKSFFPNDKGWIKAKIVQHKVK